MTFSAEPLALTGARVLVAGAGTTGVSAVAALTEWGAQPILTDRRFADDATPPAGLPAGTALAAPGDYLRSPADFAEIDLIVTSPGFPPTDAMLSAAAAAGVPVWGDVELAWRADRAGLCGAPRRWLVITGTNGKTTTTAMTEAVLQAAGVPSLACGNIGLTVLDALRAQPRADVLCLEASSFQLHWAPSLRPDAAVVLNVADDHLDWHGSFAAYRDAKAQVLHAAVAVVGADDPVAGTLPAGPASRRIGFTLGAPDAGQLGVDGDLHTGTLVDRAFGAGGVPSSIPVPLLPAAQIRPAGPSGVSDALAAAALTRALGVDAQAVAAGLAGFSPAAHRGQPVAELDGIVFIDDSKATNPHAAQAAIDGHTRVVLIAGGLLKGAPVDELIARSADRLAGVVAIGRDRDVIVDAIARHAPQVPAVTVFTGDDGLVITHRTADEVRTAPEAGIDPSDAVMAQAVRSAHALAVAEGGSPAVLLAPAAASLDMFAGYGARGDSFAAAAIALPGATVAER